MKYLKKAFSTILYILFCLIIVILLGEAITRWGLGVQPNRKAQPTPPYNTAQKDKQYGWKMTPNYSFSGKMNDAAGNPYPIDIKYDENGFKAFGDVNTEKKKVFFIGDSYTASIEASNDKSFFNLLKDSLDIEVFAYGQAGWGTLQQYMMLKEQMEIIQPDLVVWQTCANDFIDNHFELELTSGYKVSERRPYWNSKGELSYVRPVTKMKKLAQYSSFFKFVDERWTNIKFNHLKEENKIAEYFISHDNKDYEPYNTSFEITKKIMEEAAKSFKGKTKIVGFSADQYNPQRADFKVIFESNDLEYSILSSQNIVSAKMNKEVVNSSDQYHWNERGHQLVADGLVELIVRNLN